MTVWRPGRRAVLAGGLSLWAPTVFSQTQRTSADTASPPIVFVHGNGDSSALWINNLWRFESCGLGRDRLFAIDFVNPVARSDDSKPQANRSSSDDQLRELAAFVAHAHKSSGQRKVALIASSRGGNAVRNYLKNGDGAAGVSHAVLCGTPNKGIVDSDVLLPGSEFNGAAPFLKGLNAGVDDRVPGVEMMAIRSDNNDKYAQPDGRFVGAPGKPTGVSYDAAELRGAKNIVLEGLDHREVAFHKLAFAAQFEFILGKPAPTLFIAAEPLPVLNGRVTGMAGGVYTNLPMAGAEVEIHDVDPKTGERRGPQPAHRKVTGADGVWGPFIGKSEAHYEFVLRMEGWPTTHIYRSPFLRSSELVHLRPVPLGRNDDGAGAVVLMSRPRGYFGVGRDKFSLDGKLPPGINDGVPGASTGRLTFDAAPRTVVAVFNNETIPVRTFPAKEGHVVVAEFTN
ncbi:MAG: alpha/beta fold hydrolase [Enhydrobacter sp.]|nr:MAG: alpha/beta fold hydrolase [Enhydrobacter sp.]